MNQPTEQTTLTEEAFYEQFPMQPNHLVENASFDGTMYETYGVELDYVRAQDRARVWTILTDDNGLLCAVSGYHFVNRMGYLISTVPVPEGTDYFVSLEEPHTAVADQYGLACPNCGGDDALQVTITTWADLTADGTDPEGDHQWDKNSPCRCKHCDATGTVADFTITEPST